MAKIDWTKIEGYRADMSAEEKLALLDKDDPILPNPAPADPPPAPKNDPAPADPPPAPAPKPDLKGYIPKSQYDKLSSELAAAKREARAKMSEDERKEADRIAAEEALKQELDNLRKEKTQSSYKASYLALGYEEKLADATATAMVDGDMETVFANAKIHGENLEKSFKSDLLKNTPMPPAGNNPDKNSNGALYAKKLAESAAATNTESQNALNHYLGGNAE